jgi:hypothetical protein
VTGSQLSILHRDLIITLAARHKLPAIYYEKFFVSAGHERLRLSDRHYLQNRRARRSGRSSISDFSESC